MTVAIAPADLDDPRVAAVLDDHLAEMEPTAPPGRVSPETGVAPVFDPARSLYSAAGFTPCEPFGAYRPDRHSTFLTLAL